MKFTKVLLFLLFTAYGLPAFAQTERVADKVELVRANELRGGTFNGVEIRKLIGDVVFKQKDTFLYCDSAYQYADKNVMEAYGNVRIQQGDSVTATANNATYNGDTRKAKLRGNVVLQDPRMTLNTPTLDYDMDRKTAVYTEGGTIIDGTNNLVSKSGDYNTTTKQFNFRGNVVLTSPDYLITTDNLLYNTLSKVAYFNGPTNINGKDGKIYAEKGNYNTLTKVSNFEKNAKIDTEKYLLGGDKLYYDENSKFGQATGNVKMTTKTDNSYITGQLAKYWQLTGYAVVTGSPVVHYITESDTLHMAADTLVSVESKDTAVASMLYAYHDVKIFKSDLQGKCDSLVYNQKDSIMHMFRNPVLWSNKSQLVARKMELYIRNKKLYQMKMFTDSFIASEDTLKNYNQIKGTDMTAFFRDDDIRRVNVNGNGESIYYALENDTSLTGMNKAICSDMIILFADNKLNSISFLDKPVAKFIPPHELKEEDRKLDDFQWLIELQPTRASVLGPRIVKPVVKKTSPKSTKKQQKQAKQKAKAQKKAAAKKK